MPDQGENHRENSQSIAVLTVKLGMMHEDFIEMKDVLRELTAAITRLALMEQQQIQANLALERAFKGLENQAERIKKLEEKMPDATRTSGWVDKAVIAVVAAVGSGFLVKVLVS